MLRQDGTATCGIPQGLYITNVITTHKYDLKKNPGSFTNSMSWSQAKIRPGMKYKT